MTELLLLTLAGIPDAINLLLIRLDADDGVIVIASAVIVLVVVAMFCPVTVVEYAT